MFKETLILTTLFFLMFAPAPDSRDIAEMTANFLVPTNHTVLLASDKPVQDKLLEHSKQFVGTQQLKSTQVLPESTPYS